MKKQRRGLNRYNMLQNEKKKVSIHMHDTLKTNCEEKPQEKKKKKKKRQQQKTVLMGFEPTPI